MVPNSNLLFTHKGFWGGTNVVVLQVFKVLFYLQLILVVTAASIHCSGPSKHVVPLVFFFHGFPLIVQKHSHLFLFEVSILLK